ncbi:MAG: hypothetical protein IPG32_14825 [Saprospirales bacterium]|nr:hypothetical protein [Saprospirales bacterium]
MKKIINLSILFVFSGFSLSMAQAPEYGQAIYYADYFHGKRTASGRPTTSTASPARTRSIPSAPSSR